MSSHTVTVEGSAVKTVSPEGAPAEMSVEKLLGALRRSAAAELAGVMMPDGFRTFWHAGPVAVLLFEIPFGLHQVNWRVGGAPFGPECQYEKFIIALPNIELFAPFVLNERGQFRLARKRVEAHVSNTPIREASAKVYPPPLLNCSKYTNPAEAPRKCISWLCTQSLDEAKLAAVKDNGARIRASFRELRRVLLDGGFNLSSDVHEGSSWYTESAKVVKEICDLNQWQRRSRSDPTWILKQQWIDLGHTAADIATRLLTIMGATKRAAVTSSDDIARLLFEGAASHKDIVDIE